MKLSRAQIVGLLAIIFCVGAVLFNLSRQFPSGYGYVNAIYFDTPSHGYVGIEFLRDFSLSGMMKRENGSCCPAAYKIYETRDSGHTWRLTDWAESRLRAMNKSNWTADDKQWPDYGHYELSGSFFFDTKRGWLVGDEGRSSSAGGNDTSILLYTEDGGRTWQPKIISGNSLRAVFFLNEKVGWAGGFHDLGAFFQKAKPSLLKTNDGGATWFSATSEAAPIAVASRDPVKQR